MEKDGLRSCLISSNDAATLSLQSYFMEFATLQLFPLQTCIPIVLGFGTHETENPERKGTEGSERNMLCKLRITEEDPRRHEDQ